MSSAVGTLARRASERSAAPRPVLRQDRRVDAARDLAQLVEDADELIVRVRHRRPAGPRVRRWAPTAGRSVVSLPHSDISSSPLYGCSSGCAVALPPRTARRVRGGTGSRCGWLRSGGDDLLRLVAAASRACRGASGGPWPSPANWRAARGTGSGQNQRGGGQADRGGLLPAGQHRPDRAAESSLRIVLPPAGACIPASRIAGGLWRRYRGIPGPYGSSWPSAAPSL